ncbi:MAG: hypothetical protein R2873_20780 [Caldilineaceae bacterium]
MSDLDLLYVVTALVFHVALIVHFALRRWAFDSYILPWGWIMYALSIPAAAVGVILAVGGAHWSFWIGGVIYLVWAAFGYRVEYVAHIEWRNARRWPIFVPYIVLYLATVMFYWWPLALVSRPLWYVAAALFVVETVLNVTSHRGGAGKGVAV